MLLLLYFNFFLTILAYSENIYLERENEIRAIFLQGTTANEITWEISTTPELRLEMICRKLKIHKGDCSNEYVEITTDDKIDKICVKKPRFTVKAEKLIKIKVSKQNFKVQLDCVATANDGTEKPFFKDIPSEEVNSQEYGMTPGSKTTTCECGKSNKKSKKRIIFGTDAAEHEFPWAVSLQDENSFHFCGGSVVTHRHVITAAHCTQDNIASDIYAVVGVSHLTKSKNPLKYQILRIIDNDYLPRPTRRDISILITKDKIEFSNRVSPICLPKNDPKMIGKYVTAVGWGTMGKNETNREEAQLKKAHLRVVSPFDCNSFWGDRQHDDNETQICTYSRHRDICSGDSGGPVTWLDEETNRYFLVGLPCMTDCAFYRPTIHTAVHRYWEWINDMIKEYEYRDEKVCTKSD